MTSFVLKIIAMISMLIDHLGISYFHYTTTMNLIGRIAFPIFAFQISEGFIHTKNLKRYALRLLLFALISQIPFMCFRSIYTEGFALNIFFTLTLGLLSIIAYDKIVKSPLELCKNAKINIAFKIAFGILIAIILGILSELLHCDYGFFGVAIIFMFYLFKEHKVAMIISFILACVINYGLDILQYGYHHLYIWLCLFTILPIIFISFYNGKQGRKVKYLLYFFYPVHLLVLYFIFR